MPVPAGIASELGNLFAGDWAPATRRAYRSDWAAFRSWCHAHERCCLPADTNTLVWWLHDQAGAGYAVSTIQRRLLTIGQVHRRNGHPSPTSEAAVKAV